MAVMIQGLDELEIALQNRQDMERVRNVVKEWGAKLQSTMMRNANFVKGYQTGTTKRSIELDITDNGMTAKVAPGTEYSPYLEYGTRYMQAQPFVKPSYDSIKGGFVDAMKNLVE